MARFRWYLGYKYRKNPQELVNQISQKVQEYNLSQYIPLLRLEKGAKSRSEFYFFIAIESSQQGEIPPEVNNSNLFNLPFFHSPADKSRKSFTYEQIQRMVSGTTYDVHDYTNPIPYQPLQKMKGENPFDFTTSSAINYPSPDDDALSRRYEQLLYWLSALGYGTWESFKKACETLNIEEPKRILRRLKLLGHIESSSDGMRWSIAPTALVKVASESDLQEFILCGQRSINLLDRLKQHAELQHINQPRGNAPPRVRIQVDNSNNIFTLLEKISGEFSLTNAGEVSKQLANILPNIKDWKRNLKSLPGIVTSRYEWERFDGNDFVKSGLPNESGMYRMCNREISDRPLRTLFYDAERNCWLQGDWYGLRFLALQQMDYQCIANYHLNSKRLAIPASQRLPEIYERALVLASGLLPTYVDSWFLYTNVEQEVVQILSAKLNLICDWVSTYA